MKLVVNILGDKVLVVTVLTCIFLQANVIDADWFRTRCADEEFQCLDGGCIDREKFCDGSINCNDGSDENYCNIQRYSNCPEEDGTLWNSCRTVRRCYPKNFICNGRMDCPDGSDEINCGNIIQRVTGGKEAQNKLVRSLMTGKKLGHPIKKWSQDLPKIATALFLFDNASGSQFTEIQHEMSYEISLQLLPKLLRNEIETHELSLYVNALIVSCIDPRNFYDIDVVAELRKRVATGNYTNPFTILTLCNARDSMTSEDIKRVVTAFDAHYRPLWTDTQALATMALACLSRRTNITVDSQTLTRMTDVLKNKQHKNGTVDNVKTTALVIQALLATESYKKDFDLKRAVRFVIQAAKYPSIVDSYYILPLFGFKSLVDINDDHCVPLVENDIKSPANLRDNQDESMQIRSSVFIGSRMDFIRTWKLKVPVNHTFYQVLETIGSLEPQYKVHYDIANEKPYVTRVSNISDDAVAETYWFVYKQVLGSNDMPMRVHESPVDIQVNEEEELILWYRPGYWADSLSAIFLT